MGILDHIDRLGARIPSSDAVAHLILDAIRQQVTALEDENAKLVSENAKLKASQPTPGIKV